MAINHWPPRAKEDKELLRKLKQLSPEGLRNVERKVAALFVDILSKSKKPEELIELRDSMLSTPIPGLR